MDLETRLNDPPLNYDAKDLSEASDIIELGKGGLPVTSKGVKYL